jgi:hypothetical protein
MKTPFDAARNPQKKNTVISVPNLDLFAVEVTIIVLFFVKKIVCVLGYVTIL